MPFLQRMKRKVVYFRGESRSARIHSFSRAMIWLIWATSELNFLGVGASFGGTSVNDEASTKSLFRLLSFADCNK